MLYNKTIAVVVPAYNEESQIGMVIKTMPDFVDRIIVINDCSKDNTNKVVIDLINEIGKSKVKVKLVKETFVQTPFNSAEKRLLDKFEEDKIKYPLSKVYNEDINDKIILINHLKNSGKGSGIITGYSWCREYGIDCVVSMDGDGQMDPNELLSICLPIVQEGIDYVKGNRLMHKSAWLVIPKVRFLGNSILSILTKFASGYWRVSDTQTGYNAISNIALNAIQIHKIYPSYGYPNDILVKLNIAKCTIREVEIKPVYNVGEQSKMKIKKVIPTVSWLLIKSFFKRLWIKYLFKDFHPLFLLYHLSFALILFSGFFGLKIFYILISASREVNDGTLIAFIFLVISGLNSFLFAMWMDMQDNERLYK